MTEQQQFDGSRRHILDWVASPRFLDTLRDWVTPQGFTVGTDAGWMPKGWNDPRESRLFDVSSPFLDLGRKDTLRHWWLAHSGNIPNWDLIVRAEDRNGPALVLVEAKAHAGEFDRTPKPISFRADPLAQLRTNDNHLQIIRAIADASNALSGVHKGISIAWDRHYQLSNRIAMAWKLASLGIPNALVFLGFTGDSEISEGNHFADDSHWQSAFAEYIKGIFPLQLLDKDIPSGTASFRLLSRSLPAIRSSRPLADRRAKTIDRSPL